MGRCAGHGEDQGICGVDCGGARIALEERTLDRANSAQLAVNSGTLGTARQIEVDSGLPRELLSGTERQTGDARSSTKCRHA